uniref:Uncharacterized protein n=1 Tax=Amphimedon queenslandica TaxID=400682 RepID=A0A1X7TLR0_AMPQE
MVLVPPFRLVVYPVNIEIVDPCADINCNPNGACSNGVCVCHPGFTGPDCNTAYEFDPCYSSPCANGNCTYIPPNLFTCSCEPGYTGDTCNAEIDHCEGADCGNGACINTPAIGYTCECQSGYTGDHCSININDCHPNPCVNADGVQTLVNPNFSYGFASTSPKVFIGARLPHYFHFIGAIHQVVFFKEALNSTFISQLMDDYDTLVNLSGVCTNYLQIGATCPAPSAAPSALCQSSISKCNPNARCLPDVDYRYTCQPQPVVCTSDSTCQPNYYCSSGTIPNDNSNYYQNSDKSLPGQSVFLQENLMHFSEESITRTNVLPVHKVPDLVSDLTIFAIVTQEPGNDGYVIGKGLNDKMRDFGLYLRSSKSTIWVAYGSDDKGVGFHDIVFFYDVNVADGNEHSVTAVIDGSASSASLYIDGVLRGYQCPLPVKPAFRPDYNILYVGGRPGTKRFQFKGSIRNLFIGSGAFQYDNVKQLHDDAFDGDSSLSLETTDTQYCLPYISSNERCIVGNNNDFSVAKQLPIQGASFHLYGLCRTPCDCDNTVSYECGIDGNTYLNSCMRVCANVLKLHDGQCFNYALAYAACNGTFSSQ